MRKYVDDFIGLNICPNIVSLCILSYFLLITLDILAPPVVAKSDNWVPVTGVETRPRGDTWTTTKFDEMRQNIERENLKDGGAEASQVSSSSSSSLPLPSLPSSSAKDSQQVLVVHFYL